MSLALETRCQWCLVLPATVRVIATDACHGCASTTSKQRVATWLAAVEAKRTTIEAR